MALTTPPRLASEIAQLESPIVFTPVTDAAEAKAALEQVMNLLSHEGGTPMSNPGLYFDQMMPAARLSILCLLTAFHAAIV